MAQNVKNVCYFLLCITIIYLILNFTILANKLYYDFLVFTDSFSYSGLIITSIISLCVAIILAALSEDWSKKEDDKSDKEV